MPTQSTLKRAALLSAVMLAAALWPSRGHSHPGCGSGACSKSSTSSGSGSWFGRGGTVKVQKREQLNCPACGNGLGSRNSNVAVQVVSAPDPTLLQKVFRTAPQGVSILACGSDCAAKIKTRPGDHYLRVLDEVNRAELPQRPAPAIGSEGGPLLAPAGHRGN